MDTQEIFWKELDDKLQNDNWAAIDANGFLGMVQAGEKPILLDVTGADNSAMFANLQIEVVNISMNDIVKDMSSLEKYKDQTIISICAMGAKSAIAATVLRMAGYNASFILKGMSAFQ